jgi:uncharacterized protein YecE (DUF72 family)
MRLHGPDHDHLYAGSYGDADLYWWADRIREWHRQHLGAFAHLNNDGYGHAVTNARRLRTLVNSKIGQVFRSTSDVTTRKLLLALS